MIHDPIVHSLYHDHLIGYTLNQERAVTPKA
jgi:hypothetical protein